jgi:predicted anti-sigma-YlaC factor YlaD
MIHKCKEIESQLSAFLENELSPAEAENIARHLAFCPNCLDLKEKMEEILLKLPDLQEEVPFFLKNRLFNIPEISEKKEFAKNIYFPKWLAAAVGTIILFFNLFYFTNIFPSVNHEMHSVVGSIETFVVQTGGWFEKIKESKDLLLFTFFNKKASEIKEDKIISDFNLNKGLSKGGKNG